MPRVWTEEQKAELGRKVKEAAAKRKAEKEAQAASPSNGVASLVPNPIATDIIETPRVKTRVLAKPALEPEESESQVERVRHAIESLDMDTITFMECGTLLNILAATSTRIAQTRRQKQEQLDAGTQRAVCHTCGRPIDISKSGGFQILTERDEHFMPTNRYYCSQNCLLARNMPSHAKSTPREKRENQA